MALRGARGRAGEGVCVQASTLGSLEALLEFLRSPTVKIPVSGINIGPVHRRDVMRASVMLEKGRKKARAFFPHACLCAGQIGLAGCCRGLRGRRRQHAPAASHGSAVCGCHGMACVAGAAGMWPPPAASAPCAGASLRSSWRSTCP